MELGVDVKLGVTNLLYYEDLFSPTITAVMEVVNTGGTIEGEGGKFMSIYSGLPLRGGERVFVKVEIMKQTWLMPSPETFFMFQVSRQLLETQEEKYSR